MKRGLKIGIICGASVIGVAIITLVTIALIKTSSFKDSLTDFTDIKILVFKCYRKLKLL